MPTISGSSWIIAHRESVEIRGGIPRLMSDTMVKSDETTNGQRYFIMFNGSDLAVKFVAASSDPVAAVQFGSEQRMIRFLRHAADDGIELILLDHDLEGADGSFLNISDWLDAHR